MTARQQIARLLPLVLLVVLVIVGLRGAVPAPRWNGPLRADGVALGLVLEVVLAAALTVVLIRDRAARRAVARQPYDPARADLQPPEALRFVLRYVLAAGMIAIVVVLLSNLHLHFLARPRPSPSPTPLPTRIARPPAGPAGGGGSFHFPLGPVLYALLVIAIVAAVVVSLWWSTRLRRPAAPRLITAVTTEEELREAVAEGRAALAGRPDDARAAIIACYVAMERTLADRGTSRTTADTPDELLARAQAAGTIRGGGARRLTALFYEARFSSHPLAAGQRDAAAAALDELAAELSARAGS
jgi:hypothetical protein